MNTDSKPPLIQRLTQFRIWHLFLLMVVGAIFAWWAMNAGIQQGRVILLEFEHNFETRMDDEPPEVWIKFQVISPESPGVNWKDGIAEFVSIEAFVEKFLDESERANLVGSRLEFGYQQQAYFGRPAEGISAGLMRELFGNHHQVNREFFEVRPILTSWK